MTCGTEPVYVVCAECGADLTGESDIRRLSGDVLCPTCDREAHEEMMLERAMSDLEAWSEANMRRISVFQMRALFKEVRMILNSGGKR